MRPGACSPRHGSARPRTGWKSPAEVAGDGPVPPLPVWRSSTECRRTRLSPSSAGTITRGLWRLLGSAGSYGASGSGERRGSLRGARNRNCGSVSGAYRLDDLLMEVTAGFFGGARHWTANQREPVRGAAVLHGNLCLPVGPSRVYGQITAHDAYLFGANSAGSREDTAGSPRCPVHDASPFGTVTSLSSGLVSSMTPQTASRTGVPVRIRSVTVGCPIDASIRSASRHP